MVKKVGKKVRAEAADGEYFEDMDLTLDDSVRTHLRHGFNETTLDPNADDDTVLFNKKAKSGKAERMAAAQKRRDAARRDPDAPDADFEEFGQDDDEDAATMGGRGMLNVQASDAHVMPGGDRALTKRVIGGKAKIAAAAAAHRAGRAVTRKDDEDVYGDQAEEEATLALATARQARQGLADSDFSLALGTDAAAMAAVTATPADDDATAASTAKHAAAVTAVEHVARNFAALSKDEKMQLLQRESPEVARLMEELKANLNKVRETLGPLRTALFTRSYKKGSAEADLLAFLENKVQIMISYCVHVCFYLLLKLEGARVQGHPVLKRLVDLRVYLEKLWPVEQQLQQSINRLLSGVEVSGVRLGKLRAAESEDSATFRAPKRSLAADDAVRVRRQRERVEREQVAQEAEELRTFQRKRQTRAETARIEGALEPVAVDLGAAETRDHFLERAAVYGSDDDHEDSDDGDAAGPSLIERLRARVATTSSSVSAAPTKGSSSVLVAPPSAKNKKAKKTQRDESEDEAAMDEELAGLEGSDADELDYDALVAEEEDRAEASRDAKRRRLESGVVPEVDRREINRGIEKHRGLTKARPKDRKTPRANARRKYEAGMRVSKAQGGARATDAGHDGVATRNINTHVTHSRALA
jgi:U3 small nucleolar RNA-associated protein 3